MSKRASSKAIQEGFIRLSLVNPFVDYLQMRGISVSEAFASHGLNPESSKDTSIFVHSDIVYGLINAFADAAGDPHLGAHVGEFHDFASWPPFASAIEESDTLVQFFARFIERVPRETNAVRHSLEIEATRAVYHVFRMLEPGVKPTQVTGFGAAHYIRLLKSVTGDQWAPEEVTVESRFIAGVPPDYFGVTTKLITDPGIRLSFPVHWLFRPLKVDLTGARGRSDEAVEEITVVAAMRSLLYENLADPKVDEAYAANMLGIEAPRFRKALKRHGTTFSKEIKRLKIDRARELIRHGDLSLAAIGMELGYPDNSHFTRFFRSQTGMTPSQFRKSLRSTS